MRSRGWKRGSTGERFAARVDTQLAAVEELVKSYPRSDAARKAKLKLDELNKKKQPVKKSVKR